MESVNYEYFDSENDYSKNPNATKHRWVRRANFLPKGKHMFTFGTICAKI